jgi:hypothetical protein
VAWVFRFIRVSLLVLSTSPNGPKPVGGGEEEEMRRKERKKEEEKRKGMKRKREFEG